MLPQDIIRKKRDGQELTAGEIGAFVTGVARGEVSEGQVGAFCMAVLLKKMTMAERVGLTLGMARSGRVMDWSGENFNGPVLDKHSTGGVGDKVSLMLAPLLAACGAYVPMVSGRGLGHTGGTLDKMDAIPGYVSQPDEALFRKAVRETGCAIIGATSDIAPADKIIYAVRDVTATVESIDLITASILSKKLAAGLQGLVMDVKFGSGAFMRDYNDAKALADSIVSVANGAGLPTVGLLTDMNQVLGTTAGNAVEVAEAVAFLKNDNPEPRLKEVTFALCAELLVLGKLAADLNDARVRLDKALASGRGLEHFAKSITALGGPADFCDRPEKYLKPAPVVKAFTPEKSGTVLEMDVFKIGMGIVEIGGGRRVPSDAVDHSVGLTQMAQLGEAAGGDRPLCVIHARDEAAWQRMAEILEEAVTVGEKAARGTDLIRERIAA